MKRFYSKFRISLLTFAFGLASVWMFNGLSSKEVDIKLPKIQSKSPIIYSKVKTVSSCFQITDGHWANDTMEKCNKKKVTIMSSFE